MTQYPLLFGYKDLVAGNGFLAGVAIDGRALITEDEEGVWVYSVTPGGICADGDSQKEAAAEFRTMYRAMLFDIAEEADDFEHFEAEVKKLFADENRVLAQEWDKAVEAVRSGEVGSDWLEKQPAESPRRVHVIHISESETEDQPAPPVKRPKPSFNSLDSALLAA